MAKALTIEELTSLPTNSRTRREESYRQKRCQRCAAKVDLAKQKSVQWNDGKAAKVGKATEKSHYCPDCAEARRKQLSPKKARTNGRKTKATPKKAAPKSKATPKRKTSSSSNGRKAKTTKAAPKRRQLKSKAKSGGRQTSVKASDEAPF